MLLYVMLIVTYSIYFILHNLISSQFKSSGAADEDLAKMFQDREDRLKRHHNDEIKEWEDRVAKLQGKFSIQFPSTIGLL